MKALKMGLVIALFISSASAIIVSQKLYAADTNKNSTSIEAYQDRIAVEREAIIADSRKLQEAKKTGDATKIEQVRQETSQDIKQRKAKIKALRKEMKDNNTNINNTVIQTAVEKRK